MSQLLKVRKQDFLILMFIFYPSYFLKNKSLKHSYTGYTQKNGAVSKVNKEFISHLTRAQHTPSAAATGQVSHALITVLQCVHPGSHDTHPHGNQTHPRPYFPYFKKMKVGLCNLRLQQFFYCCVYLLLCNVFT
jgi:hypothetical protein